MKPVKGKYVEGTVDEINGLFSGKMTPKPAAHTPAPWFAKVDSKNEKVDILTVEKPIKDDEENLRECVACVFDKANAAFIVRAVNNHQILIDTIKSLRDGFEQELSGDTCANIDRIIEIAEGK